ncbi:MAG TPA: apolipoprotein N-acyltransferase, partial [Anaerolineae bacterium]|nr:apolipoprotein N-acyltransferase [Anaerolineae bacterium]
MKTSTACLYAVLSGLFLCLAYPPFGFGFIAYTALVPMFYVLEFFRPRTVFLLAWLSGIFFLGVSLFWICFHADVTWPVMLLVVVVLAFFYALPFICASYIGKLSQHRVGLIVFPFSVAGIEWIRSFDQLAFPWMILGNSQTCYPWLIQFADITSAFGVSWWVALVNVSVFLLIKKKKSIVRWSFLALLFVVPFTYSWIVMHHSLDSGRKITVALIQGNVTIEEKWGYDMEFWNVNLYRTMSIEAMVYHPDLIVWPETATPVYLLESPTYRRMVHSLVDSIGVPVLTGFPSIDFDTEETWNSAGLFLPGLKEVKRYDKLHLVPFGEAIPMDDFFPALKKIDLGQANWSEGKGTVVFTSPQLPPFNVA